MTPERLNEIVEAMRWHRKDGSLLAPAVGLSTDRTTIRRWRNGSNPIPNDVAAWLEDLKATLDRSPKGGARDDVDSGMTAERLRDIVENSLVWNTFHLVATLAADPDDRDALWRDVIRDWFKGTRTIPTSVAAWLEDMDALMERAPNVAGRRQIDITSDGRTVWVNLPSGCIGHFGLYGVDVHTTPAAQIEGTAQCLDCTHAPTTLTDWRRFQAALQAHYDIEVGDEWIPARLRAIAV